MRHRLPIVTAALIFIIIGLLGCGNEKAPAPVNHGYVYLGLTVPQSGILGPMSSDIILGARMAADAANERGGINVQGGKNRRLIKILVEDELAVITESNKLANDPRVKIIIGHLTERAFEAARPLYLKSNLPVLLPFLSGDSVSISPEENFFQLMASDTVQAHALAAYGLKELKAARFLIIYEDSEHSRALADAFGAKIEAAPEASVLKLAYPDGKDQALALKALSAEALKYKPDAVFLMLPGAEAISAVKALSDKKVKTVVMGTYALAFQDTAGFIDRYTEQAFFSLPFDPANVKNDSGKFIDLYLAGNNREPGWMAAVAYDAVNLSLKALEAAGDDRQGLIDYLSEMDRPAKAFQGLCGDYYFESGGKGPGPVHIVELSPSLLDRLP